MKDMTKGNEAKLLILFALPMLLGNIFQQLYFLTDTIIVGNLLGENALSAVGISFPIMFMLIALMMGVGMGSSILVSQLFGAKEKEKVTLAIETTFITSIIMSIVITVMGLLVTRPVLLLLNTPLEILPQAEAYLKVIFLGMIGMTVYNLMSAILRGLGDAVTPLIFLVITTVINIGLDLLLIGYFKFGVEGAAIATVLAQTISSILVILKLGMAKSEIRLNLKKLHFRKDLLTKMLAIGMPIGISQMVSALGLTVIQGVVNTFGTQAIAAYTVGNRINSFGTMPALSLGMAMSSFTGQNIGASEFDRVKRGLRANLTFAILISLFLSVLIWIFGEQMIRMFLGKNMTPEILIQGVAFLRISSAFYFLFAVMQVLSGVVKGAGKTMAVMGITIFSLWAVQIPVANLLSSKVGTNGIWWSLPLSWLSALLLMMGYYFSNKWVSKA